MEKKEKKSRAVWTGIKLSEDRGENIRLSYRFLFDFLSMTNLADRLLAFHGKVPSCHLQDISLFFLASKQSSAFHSRTITYFYTWGENTKIRFLST